MPRHRARLLPFPAVVVFSSLAILSAQAPPNPPVAKKMPKQTTLHGVTLVDDYHWLRDKGSPDVTAYLEAENVYTEAGHEAHRGAAGDALQRDPRPHQGDRISRCPCAAATTSITRARRRGRTTPSSAGRRAASTRRRRSTSIRTRWPRGRSSTRFGGLDVSPDGTKVIYLEDLTAFREYTLYVKDIASGKILDSLPKVWNGTAWANDNRTFFYMTADAAKRGDTVWRHVLGAPREKDAKIFHEPDVLFNAGVGRMRSDEYIVIRAGSFTLANIVSSPPRTRPPSRG